MPESRGVIEVVPVGEFVNDDVVDDAGRGVNKAPVEVEVATTRAAPPPRFLLAQRDLVKGDFHRCRDLVSSGNNIFFGGGLEETLDVEVGLSL